MKDTLSGRDERMLMKLVVDAREPTRSSAATSSGPDAAEIVQMAAIAMRMGATKADFDRHHGAASERRGGTGHHARQVGAAQSMRCGIAQSREQRSHAGIGQEGGQAV